MFFPYRLRLYWLALSLASVGLSACGSQSTAESTSVTEAAPTLPVLRLVGRDTVISREYVADVQAVRNVELRARVRGFLEKIYVDEGQAVKKGQPLFQLNADEYRTRLARARATLSNATARARVASLELDRVELLTKENIISKTELDVTQAKLAAARSTIEEARSAASNAALMVSYTTIRAPFDGVVNRELLKVGSLIDEGTLLTTVTDSRAVYAYFNVSEAEYLQYTKRRQQDAASNRDEVRLVLADGSLYAQPGRIETVESQFQPGTGAIAFRARFENPRQLLRHGATGKVRLADPLTQALLVPQKAVFEQQDKNYVFVVDDKGVVRQQNFVPRNRLDAFYVVSSGLKSGQNIVCEGIQDLREGSRITPRPVELSSLTLAQ